jgi:glycosyltransferase involved in cell wall biosynthesis
MVSNVSVVLSTFNGAAYLPEQLDSLLGQTYSNLAIHVRDDGSSDETRRILQHYAAKHPKIRLAFGTRLGVTRSFFNLLQHTEPHSQYFAFCDQDDVWHPGKVERAVWHLSQLQHGVPALYCCRLEYVDEKLGHLKYSRLPRKTLQFENALVENCATGCTVVLNRVARDLITSRLPKIPVRHDWWCYLAVSAFGTIVYDATPGVKYRLHGANDTGAGTSLRDNLSRRTRRFLHNGGDAFRIHAQAELFARLYAESLSRDKRRVLERFLASKQSRRTRMQFALKPGVYRQSRIDDVLLRMLFILNWY